MIQSCSIANYCTCAIIRSNPDLNDLLKERKLWRKLVTEYESAAKEEAAAVGQRPIAAASGDGGRSSRALSFTLYDASSEGSAAKAAAAVSGVAPEGTAVPETAAAEGGVRSAEPESSEREEENDAEDKDVADTLFRHWVLSGQFEPDRMVRFACTR